MFKKIFIALIFVSQIAFAQHKKEEPKPVFHEVSNKDIIQSVYPEAVKVEKENDYWYKILNSNSKIIGYAMSSAPYCQDVKGYSNLTPVLIVMDMNLIIKKISLLSNWESIGYVRKLEKKGFFDLWNDKTIKEAKTVKPDGYTGATCTALAVSKNVDFLLENGIRKLPKKPRK